MFGEAIAEVLRYVKADDVVVLGDEHPRDLDWRFDAAVVTAVPPALRADVVIELQPEGETGSDATVRANGSCSEATINTPLQLVTLLDELCPSDGTRVTPLWSGVPAIDGDTG